MTNTASTHLIQKLLLVAAAIITLGGAILSYFLLSPNGYISLDINPSIELRTNRLDQVTSVIGANAEGKALLDGYRLTDRDLDHVIADLVDQMVLQGYLGENLINDVLVTVDDGDLSPQTLERINSTIEDYLGNQNLTANVIGQSVAVDGNLLETAARYQISAGKMNVIDRLVSGDPTLLPSELAQTRISDLMAYAKEQNIPLELLEERLDDMEDHYNDKALEQLEDALDDVDDLNDVDDNDTDDDVDDQDDDFSDDDDDDDNQDDDDPDDDSDDDDGDADDQDDDSDNDVERDD